MAVSRWLGLSVALCSLSAFASGFYFGDNGSTTLVQGGAFTAQANDVTAIQHNPAGLAQMRGLSFVADFALINADVTFARQDPGYDPDKLSTIIVPVKNQYGLYTVPFLGLSYGFDIGGRPLTIAAGVYGPPAEGAYNYGEVDYTKDFSACPNATEPCFARNPRKYAANRYALIRNDIVIGYPTLSVAFAPHPRFMVGASFQLVFSSFKFKQALWAGDSVGLNPQRQLEEDPAWDAVVAIDLVGKLGFTGILGVLGKPTDWLSLGASIRPPIPMRGSGRISLELGEKPTEAGAVVVGNQADLAFTMPLELRFGARLKPIERLGINVDFLYQGWSSVDAQVVTPREVYLQTPGRDPSPVPVFRVPKNYQGTYSVRLGANFDVIKYLTVHAGGWWESMAAPLEYYNIDFPNPDRFFVTGGVTVHLPIAPAGGMLDLTGGFLYTPTVVKDIFQSEVRRAQSDPAVQAGVVGAGQLTSGGWIVTFGLKGNFDWVKKPEAAPTPVPAPTPAPAPAPAEAAPAS